jgi:DNA mismatch endonuclease (patch repair protein)
MTLPLFALPFSLVVYILGMDRLTKDARSALMKKVRARDTKPELQVRRLAHKLGLRFRIQRSDIAGKPDLVLPKYRIAMFVHGCFWHRHPGCLRASTPSTNTDHWLRKFERNTARDAVVATSLRQEGWKQVIIWECELKDLNAVERRILEAVGRD